MISAKVVADSKNEFGNRITTMVITFPRIILAEFNTHRMFSRNSASSRAIPFEKMVKSVEENPFIPIAWQKDHKGMQGTEYHTLPTDIDICYREWLKARDNAIVQARSLANWDVTKQLCNRLLEPFMWHTVIVTATEWENFFALRCPQYEDSLRRIYRSKKDVIKNHEIEDYENYTDIDWLKDNKGQAEIHMMALAESMWDAYNESTPKKLKAGEWHIPFGDNIFMSILDQQDISTKFPSIHSLEELKIRIATARCAQVSYTVVGEDGKESSYENLIKLHDRLSKAGHWSPFEHCAVAMTQEEYDNHRNGNTTQSFRGETRGWSGNFRGFIQYRKMFANENITK